MDAHESRLARMEDKIDNLAASQSAYIAVSEAQTRAHEQQRQEIATLRQLYETLRQTTVDLQLELVKQKTWKGSVNTLLNSLLTLAVLIAVGVAVAELT